MRTKTLLLTAAVVAMGTFASQAQVYSVNAVGYVNKSAVAGYSLLANPLNGASNNNINAVIPVAPADALAIRWNRATQKFNAADTYYDLGNADSGWYDKNDARSTSTLPPGEAFFFFNPGASTITLTFVGEVPQGQLTNSIVANYGFYSSVVPQTAGLDAMGFPTVADMLYITWNPATQKYNAALTYYDLGNADSGWYDKNDIKVTPTPVVGEGFVIFNPGATVNWTRTFSVN